MSDRNIPNDEKSLPWVQAGNWSDKYGGLTKRELFAAMAMQGWLAGCENAYSEFTAPGTNTHVAAESAVKFADALLAALDVSKENTSV